MTPRRREGRSGAGAAREGRERCERRAARRTDMGTPGSGRRRLPNRERLTAEDDALNQIAREAEARLAAKRAARAEAREIRMKELERQQKEIYQVQKKYYGLDTKWGDIEQWMEDSERYSRRSRRNTSASDEDERMSVGSRGSLRSQPDLEYGGPYAWVRWSDRCRGVILIWGGVVFYFLFSSKTTELISVFVLLYNFKNLTRFLQDSLAEVEEKYKKAMVSNAQLDNEKTNFLYQVDTLKDMLLELEEQLAESRRQYDEKNKELEREKHAHSILQFQFAEVKEALKQREELLEEIRQLQQKQASYIREISDLQETIEWKDKKIGALERQKEFFDSIRSDRDDLREEIVMLKEELKKHGIVLNSELATNGETSDTLNDAGHQGPSKITKEELNALRTAGDGMLDIRLKKLVDERECLLEQIKKLKGQLEERQKNGKLDNLHPGSDVLENGTDMHVMDLQRDANRQISDLKFKLAKSEQEITALEQNVIRLESQVSRYKSAAENAEKIEDELKAEKRKLQRELRCALDKTEELEVSNGHLVKRLEKMKANRSALLSQQ
nr:leucine-rich repeat flightless-interacting protein 2-like [Mirounga angustirostris]